MTEIPKDLPHVHIRTYVYFSSLSIPRFYRERKKKKRKYKILRESGNLFSSRHLSHGFTLIEPKEESEFDSRLIHPPPSPSFSTISLLSPSSKKKKKIRLLVLGLRNPGQPHLDESSSFLTSLLHFIPIHSERLSPDCL